MNSTQNQNFSFGTKAETLQSLLTFQTAFNVPDFIYFSIDEYLSDPNIIFERIEKMFSGNVAVRSSAVGEDSESESMAGAYQSILDVDPFERSALKGAIEAVLASYGNKDDSNQILIQEMVHDVSASGVIMTRVLDDGAPYYLINYDDVSGQTDSITGGKGEHKTVLLYCNCTEEDCDSERVKKMLRLAQNLEKICGSYPLDIEFAISVTGAVYLFQVRKISTANHWRPDSQLVVNRLLKHVEDYITALSQPRRGLAGSKTIIGNMPDWNPAEIIGVHPAPLSISLYRHLITSDSWRLARMKMGYRKIPKTELMVTIASSPYIDVRASFNSFLPAGLSFEISDVLVNAWLDRLSSNPELHDKIEFEIVPTVFDFDFESRFSNLYPDLLDQDQLQSYATCLHKLTANALDLSAGGTLAGAYREIEVLKLIQDSDAFTHPTRENEPTSIAAWIDSTLDDCITHGTIPFSILARHGFIAETLLRSMSRLGVINDDRIREFKSSFPTVLGRFFEDIAMVVDNNLSKESFLGKYGHLRPGTYDILSPTYRERSDIFGQEAINIGACEHQQFKLTYREKESIDKVLKRANFVNIDANGFLEYARRAITGREYSKFVFTKSLSAVLDAIVKWGRIFGVTREELSMLTIEDILVTIRTSSKEAITSSLMGKVDIARIESAANKFIKLGYLIRDIKDLYVIPVHRSAPNFITSGRAEGKIVHLNPQSTVECDLKGKIVCIENADPGFDWIFSNNIAGLITKYGGANSHMAIRCAEISLPAAIGCGEQVFTSLVSGKMVYLSCKEKTIKT